MKAHARNGLPARLKSGWPGKFQGWLGSFLNPGGALSIFREGRDIARLMGRNGKIKAISVFHPQTAVYGTYRGQYGIQKASVQLFGSGLS